MEAIVKGLLADCQQEQLACYWDELSTEEQAALADQILGLGLDTQLQAERLLSVQREAGGGVIP